MWLYEGLEGDLWIGRLSDTEKEGKYHGLWTIGNAQPKEQPGYHETLMYKTWYGHPRKYLSPGHSVGAGAHGGHREYVMVMDGCLECHYLNQRHQLYYPHGTDLPATIERTWVLPRGTEPSRGFAICRPDSQLAKLQAGQGEGYELHILDPSGWKKKPQHPGPDMLRKPTNLVDWSWSYLEVFRAEVLILRNETPNSSVVLRPGEHAFFPASKWKQCTLFPLDATLRAVVLYY